uniref:Uncharacterized protein n=1 Tax=Melopsittacus undulatus TaxID=13146 RepID=A0A8C6IN98_MELUD
MAGGLELDDLKVLSNPNCSMILCLGMDGMLAQGDYCPKGWYYYKLSCFKYFSQLQSWDEAERQCQASYAGAHLAWVEEPKEAATLQKVIFYYQHVQPVWLGLRYGQQVRLGAAGWWGPWGSRAMALIRSLCTEPGLAVGEWGQVQHHQWAAWERCPWGDLWRADPPQR